VPHAGPPPVGQAAARGRGQGVPPAEPSQRCCGARDTQPASVVHCLGAARAAVARVSGRFNTPRPLAYARTDIYRQPLAVQTAAPSARHEPLISSGGAHGWFFGSSAMCGAKYGGHRGRCDAFSTEFALGRGGDDVMAVAMAATTAPRLAAPLLCLVLLGPYAAAWDRATGGYRGWVCARASAGLRAGCHRDAADVSTPSRVELITDN
jgi:hypothetical protein